jgi:hypothetical protein
MIVLVHMLIVVTLDLSVATDPQAVQIDVVSMRFATLSMTLHSIVQQLQMFVSIERLRHEVIAAGIDWTFCVSFYKQQHWTG